ncbi:MAG: sulfite exporter TauE/SafE family protein [Desulfuromonas sp.]|nr:MAG: sulfite exporter TauE/SafE family protein [Desulfuromonas sp.]
MEIFSLTTILLFFLFGSLAGFLAGLLGIGGGVILVPLFIWGFKLAGFAPVNIVHLAFGTSLAIIIPTALSSTFGHRKRGNVDWHQVMSLAIGGIVGAFVGATIAAQVEGDYLKGLFGVMQILVAVKLLFFHPHVPPERDDAVPKWQLIAVGLVGGAFSAFFGVGGGVVAVPLMVLVLQLPIHLAVGNSSALIFISTISGTFSYALYGWGEPLLPPFSIGYINLLVVAIVAPFTIIFARLGVRVASRTPHDKLVTAFAVLLTIVGIRMLYPVLISFFSG